MVLSAAAVTSFLFVLLVLGSLTYNPRLWKQDFPKAVQEELAPLSLRERFERALLAILLGGVVIGIPLLTLLNGQSTRGEVTLLDGFLHFWLIFMGVNLVDLVVIDWLIGMRWQPAFLDSPEIEPFRQHNSVRFHVVEHVKGALLLAGLALVLAGVVTIGGFV